MAVGEKRTLTIEARLKNYLGKELTGLQRTVATLALGWVKSWNTVSRLVFNLKTGVVALAGAFGAFKLVEFTRQTAEQADELGKLAASTGDLIENLSELQAAFDLGGVKDFTATIRGLTKAQGEALQGNEQFVEGFRELNISLEDLRTLGPSQLFERIAEGLDLVGTEQERAVALSKILPRQFLELLPVVGRGIQQFRQAVVDAREVGATITTEQAKIAEELNDSFTKVEIAAKAAGRELVRAFGPEATELLTRVARFIKDNRSAIVDLAKTITGALVTAFNQVLEVVARVISAIDQIPGVGITSTRIAQLEREVELEKAANLEREKFIEFVRARDADLSRRTGLVIESKKELDTYLRGLDQGRERIQQLSSEIEGLRLVPDIGQRILNVRDELSESIRQARAEIESSGQEQAAAVAQQGVPALGLPSLEGLRAYAEQAAAQVKTVFRSTSGRPRLPDPEQDPVTGSEPAIPKMTEDLREAKVESDDFFGGVNEGLGEAMRRWTDLAQAGREAARSLVDGGLTGLTEAFGSIIDGTKSAKEAFKDFATGLLQDIARLIPRLLLVRALGGIFGTPAPAFAEGGIGGGVTQTARVRAFARGGVTNGPTWALMGEAGRREAFVPLPDNRSIPVTLTGGGGGGNVVINITAMDGKDVRRVLIEERGTIQRIWTNQMQTRNGARTVVRKAAS